MEYIFNIKIKQQVSNKLIRHNFKIINNLLKNFNIYFIIHNQYRFILLFIFFL